MAAHPNFFSGTLRKHDGKWHVELHDSSVTFDENAPLRLIIWDARGEGSRSDIETIASVQQLAPEVVATALMSEGSLSSATDFRERTLL
jgi:hypothetical protein